MEVDYLCQPSLPLTKKRRVPSVAAVAFFYSEETETVYHAFATDDLRQALGSRSRFQAAALLQDPSSRVGWIKCSDVEQRNSVLADLNLRFNLVSPSRDVVAA